MQRPEVHVCRVPNGHVSSVDCWCEPVEIRLVKNVHGVMVFVVEHNDLTLQHRIIVVAERERDKCAPFDPTIRMLDVDQPWITRALSLPEGPRC